MPLALIALGIVSLIELSLWFTRLWRWRKSIAGTLILLTSVISGLLFGAHFAVWAGLVLFFSLYRMINLLRILQGRSQPDYLLQAGRATSWRLMVLQLVILGLATLQHSQHWSWLSWLYGLAGVQLVMTTVLLSSTLRHLRTTRPPSIRTSTADRDLPTLTVAIPARNETDDLDTCLQSLTASTYPKLEILVLDDCSQNKRTPEIIRAFAHSGVRFIAGTVPPDRWLAKNYAYKQLADEANGELLLFCGVDTRFEPNSLRLMVETLLARHKTMLSLIPRNQLPSAFNLEAVFIQPGRYAWELSLPRRALNRPPVLSTCWLISRKALKAAGGLAAVAHKNSVESYFARQTAHNHDGYSFLQSTPAIGLSSAKNFMEQRDTAIRTRYPQVHRRPELVSLLTLAELATMVAPFGVALGALLAQSWLLLGLSLASCLLLVTAYSKVVALTYRRFLLRGLWLAPIATLYDIGLLHYSMWQYEFGEIIWKGRNVCLPVMRATPS